MNPLETIFLRARSLADPAERAAYLAQDCGADDALRQRVEALLADANAAAAFFGEGDTTRLDEIPPDAEPLSSPVMIEDPGAVIGHYKLLQKIGEGGFGAVYMAEQQEPVRRRVALKVIKLGMDTRAVIARFEAERQALALMDHPNIAKVLDAGTTATGRP
jgi:serine/threonine protein kinase